MSEQNKNNIETNNSTISAEGSVELVGGNQYKIGGDIYKVDISAPTYGTSIDQLQKSLESNRLSLRDNLTELEDYFYKGFDLDDGRVQAIIKDIITESKNIELLIPAIKQLDTKMVKSMPYESNTLVRINAAILNGRKQAEHNKKIKKNILNKLNKLQENLKNAYNELGDVEKFKFFRSTIEKWTQQNDVKSKINKIKLDIQELKKNLKKFENL